MKAFNKSLLVLLLAGTSYYAVSAQDSSSMERGPADSLQRISMRDSLNFSDTLITLIYGIRNSMISKVLLLRNDFSIPDREVKIMDLANQANENIRQLLGQEGYQKYTEMIRSRSKKSANADQSPLAGGAN
jgi:hypothetical protein